MGSLAHALTALQMEFSDDLTYMPGMAPRSANQAEFEEGGMQVCSSNYTFLFAFPEELVGIDILHYLSILFYLSGSFQRRYRDVGTV